MKLLDVSSFTDASKFPVKKGTLQFLQDAHKETVSKMMRSLIGPTYNPSIVYILEGVTNSLASPFYNIIPGSAFYNDEIYQIDAAAFTSVGADVAIFINEVQQYTVNADPVTFTDLAIRNVHNIRKLKIVSGASGSGLSNYSQAVFLNFNIPAQLNLTASTVVPHADNLVQLSGAYPNIDVYVPAGNNAYPTLYAGTFHVGDIGGSHAFIGNVTFPSVGTSNYNVSGCLLSNGPDPTADTACWWSVKNKTNTQFTLEVYENFGAFQNIDFDYSLIKR